MTGDVASTESLARAGFTVDAAGQQRFASRIAQRLYARLAFPRYPELLPAAGFLACAVGAALRAAAGDTPSAAAAAVAGGLHLLLALAGWVARRGRARAEGPEHPYAAVLVDGELRPRLSDGEQVLLSLEPDGPARPLVPVIGGLFQTFWGLLLGGLPLAIGGAHLGGPAFALTVFATLVGTALFGRGLRALVSTTPAQRLVLTDRRLVAIVAPGVARSLWLEDLRHRPVVVERSDGRFSVGVEIRPRESVAPLPLMSLWGLDDVDEGSARKLAGAVMDARKHRLAAGARTI